jgi:hypothetical protein
MVGTQRFLPDRQRLACQRYGFGELAGSIQLHDSFIECGRVLLCNRWRTGETSRQCGGHDKTDAASMFHEIASGTKYHINCSPTRFPTSETRRLAASSRLMSLALPATGWRTSQPESPCLADRRSWSPADSCARRAGLRAIQRVHDLRFNRLVFGQYNVVTGQRRQCARQRDGVTVCTHIVTSVASISDGLRHSIAHSRAVFGRIEAICPGCRASLTMPVVASLRPPPRLLTRPDAGALSA